MEPSANSEKKALLFSLLAGLSTGIGGAVVLCLDSVSNATLAAVYALAAGVMVSVSVLELLKPIMAAGSPFTPPVFWMMAGAGFYAVLRKLVPDDHGNTAVKKRLPDDEADEVHEQQQQQQQQQPSSSSPPQPSHQKSHEGGGTRDVESGGKATSLAAYRSQQWRLGVLMMITLTLHNLPEGMAVTVATLTSARAGLTVMIAIAIHNIPEGLAIAIPVYAATGDRWKAMGCTLASGMSEPIGARISILVLRPFLNEDVVDNASCAVGGIMMAVSALELWPESRRRNDWPSSLAGFAAGWLAIVVTVQYA